MAGRQGALEGVDGLNRSFWQGKQVFLTGHTGFKGSWLALWLADLGATVTGYALRPPTEPSLFAVADIENLLHSIEGDVRDAEHLKQSLLAAQPAIVLHLAAQPLVRESFRDPAATYATNVMGAVNLLEAVRACGSVRAVVNVTTDKCYENREWIWPYRENEPLGGYDPYSSSKACSELVTAAYRSSFFAPERWPEHGVAVATARAGNVIGGGDWAAERLVPDCLRALLAGEMIRLRNPGAIRPWQYVLEPLRGYLTLAERLHEAGPRFAEAWNFGPAEADCRRVEFIAKELCRQWGNPDRLEIRTETAMHEAAQLRLDASKAGWLLDWRSACPLDTALAKIVDWTKAWQAGADMRQISLAQIHDYEGMAQHAESAR